MTAFSYTYSLKPTLYCGSMYSFKILYAAAVGHVCGNSSSWKFNFWSNTRRGDELGIDPASVRTNPCVDQRSCPVVVAYFFFLSMQEGQGYQNQLSAILGCCVRVLMELSCWAATLYFQFACLAATNTNPCTMVMAESCACEHKWWILQVHIRKICPKLLQCISMCSSTG